MQSQSSAPRIGPPSLVPPAKLSHQRKMEATPPWGPRHHCSCRRQSHRAKRRRSWKKARARASLTKLFSTHPNVQNLSSVQTHLTAEQVSRVVQQACMNGKGKPSATVFYLAPPGELGENRQHCKWHVLSTHTSSCMQDSRLRTCNSNRKTGSPKASTRLAAGPATRQKTAPIETHTKNNLTSRVCRVTRPLEISVPVECDLNFDVCRSCPQARGTTKKSAIFKAQTTTYMTRPLRDLKRFVFVWVDAVGPTRAA
jgi:hypothetical protein